MFCPHAGDQCRGDDCKFWDKESDDCIIILDYQNRKEALREERQNIKQSIEGAQKASERADRIEDKMVSWIDNYNALFKMYGLLPEEIKEEMPEDLRRKIEDILKNEDTNL